MPKIIRHSRESGNPGLKHVSKSRFKAWIPAFAGMTMWVFFAAIPSAYAAWEEEPKISTDPIGSPYYRHLAEELHQDLRQLVKFEKKGFGRTEIVALIIISSTTGKPLRDYGNRRIKNNVTLKQFAEEGHIDHAQLISESRRIKEQIEAMGDQNLPPPLYEMGEIIQPVPSKNELKRLAKEKKRKEKEQKQNEAP